MTKKGIILAIILFILLVTIIIVVATQNTKPNNVLGSQNLSESSIEYKEQTELDITEETGFDLEKLKAYKLPVLIQFANLEDEICFNMQSDVEELNEKMKGKAIVKFLDIKKYSDLIKDERLNINSVPVQLLINSDGTPYKGEESEIFGYKKIKSEDGTHIYTIHEGDLTLEEMKAIITKMTIK
ncbi:MAG: hypothetical protein HFJ52_08515 [Clostridia bacterium]|nr:hypothetical protein [Clostridia bacterium]